VNFLGRTYRTATSSLTTESQIVQTNIAYPVFFNDINELSRILVNGESIIDAISNEGMILINAILECTNQSLLYSVPYFHSDTFRNKVNKELLVLIAVTIEKDDFTTYSRLKELSRFEGNEWLTNYAIKRKSVLITKDLVKKDYMGTYMSKIAEINDIDFFTSFLNPINNKEHFIKNALLSAVRKGNYDIVRVVLPSCSGDVKNQAIDHVKSGDIQMVKLLIDGGAMFTYRESEGSHNIPLSTLTMVIKTLLDERK
jgi:hypothetical protein